MVITENIIILDDVPVQLSLNPLVPNQLILEFTTSSIEKIDKIIQS